MNLYFTRHGKTVWNLERKLQGKYGDSPLLEESFEQIKLLSKHLKEVPFTKIYTSPSVRAVRTAEAIQKNSNQVCEIFREEDLREIGFGDLEGSLIVEANATYPVEMQNLRTNITQYNPKSFKGESAEELLARFTRCVEKIVCTAKDEHVLIISHGMTLAIGIHHLLGLDIAKRPLGRMGNNTLTHLTKEKGEAGYGLKIYNEDSFLGDRQRSEKEEKDELT